ncbi:antibiotic ABC transporter permease [Adhaeribacter arboris]|uniref:Antibiotic ABC transporter permease n=1 Tax=Adhaeribacter arboris TaxID=2072846 RepID=A0A2T2YC90_9BACT|nr:ABC transporter permease [Adhaeribacter arboris]PSR53058.1 antibiotic ABC transporter permease [Adhaeribacter arboris]
MKMKLQPPAWLDQLLTWRLPAEQLEEVQGDLHELYNQWTEEKGKRKAQWQYTLSVLSFLRPLPKRNSHFSQTNYSSLIFQSDMIRSYLKIAFRTLARNKVYSAINVMGLSIGLAAAMLIMLYTKDELSYDRFHRNNPHIYRITGKNITPEGKVSNLMASTGLFQGPKFAAAVPEIQSFVRFHENRHDLKRGQEIISQTILRADSSFFSIFSFPLRRGNPKTALQQPNSVVISEKMAEQQFGTTDALGKVIFLKDSFAKDSQFAPYLITGVARNSPQNSSIKFDVLLPFVEKKEDMQDNENWFNIFLNTFVVLRPDANIKAVEAKMNRVYQADAKEAILKAAEKYGFKDRQEFSLQPFTAMHLSKDLPADNGLVDASNPMFSYILSGIAVFILLIACINFINLTVARSLKRAREIGVRKVMGGGRLQLTVQFLGESYVLCFLAFLSALALVYLTLPTFNQLANKALSLSYLLDTKLVMGYLALFLVTGLLSGFYPALVLSSYNPVQTLYNRFNLVGKNYLQKFLVVLQFAIASFLIIGTLTIYSQFNYLTRKNLGYDDKHVISVEKANLTRPEAKLLQEQLTQNPNILAVAPKNGGRWGTLAKVNGDAEINFEYETVDPAYLSLFKIPVIAGRNFSRTHPSDSVKSVLVNEAFVEQAGWKAPLGQTVDFWYNNEKYTVIGVVKNYHYAALNEKIGPQLFTMRAKNGYGKIFLKIKPQTESASLQYLEETFTKLFPLHAYKYEFLDENNLKKYEAEAKWKQIMLFGALLTIFISCIGLFGLATFTAEQRTKEIGIRKVLGASVTSIVRLLSSDFLKLVGFSFVFAFPAAYYATAKWLQNYPYRIDISAWTFVIAAVSAVLVAFCTVSFQSIRAARVNPVKNLRSE